MKKYSLFTAISLVIANMVGTGVFTSLGFQVMGIHSGAALVLLWLLGGVVALLGALAYSELGAAMPRSGGEYHFLSTIYHPSVGFMSGWISFIVGFAAPVAAAAIAFGTYLTHSLHIDIQIPFLPFLNSEKIFGIVILILLTAIHVIDKSIGSAFQNILTFFKIGIILILIILGLIFGYHSDVSFAIDQQAWKDIMSPAFAVSLFFVSYAYSGWNAAAYIAGEIKNPSRNIPLSLIFGTLFVTIIYVLLNFIFLYTTPIGDMAGKVEIGYVFADRILGTETGKIMGLIIAFLLISSMSAMVIAGPRVSQVMGEDYRFFRILSRKNKYDVPIYGIIIQSVLSLIYIITSGFEQVIVFIGFTLNLFTFLTVLGVIIHRIKHPELIRPYKTLGYPVVPILFLIINTWILVYGLIYKPQESLFGIGISLIGLLFYYFGKKK